MQVDERLAHCRGQPLVHREALARPVGCRPEAPHLVGDRGTGRFLPLPDALDERLAAEIVTRLAGRFQLLLDDDLRRDAGVVGPHLPQRVEAAHPVIADQHVHQRLLERVTHVQRARHVGWRELDAVRRGTCCVAGLEIPARLP